jgi:phospholipase A1/A2
LALVANASSAFAQTVTQVDEQNAIRLSAHRPLYFLFGDPVAKVQLSAKEQIFAGVPLYVGYTQLMLWDFGKESTPFNDVNFNPEFFYRFQLSDAERLDLGFFEHASNGKAGEESRSINSSYLAYTRTFEHENFEIEPGLKVAGFWALDHYNKDYRDYLGFWTGTLRLSMRDIVLPYAEFNFEIRPGGQWGDHFGRGYEQFELALKFDRTDFLPYLYIQYFNGYGESLITYRQWSSNFRIGFRK